MQPDFVTEECATATLPPPRRLEVGEVVASRYVIEEMLGKGGSGIVFRAFDRVRHLAVAVKIVNQTAFTDGDCLALRRELRLVSGVEHPNVCPLFDVVESYGHQFIVMELARGSLQDDVRSAPFRRLGDRVQDVHGIVDGVAALHAAGLVHRDIKPANILRMTDDRVAISDFGLMMSLDEGRRARVAGTPAYMAPEVLAGAPAGFAADVWALGIAIHEIVFGLRPSWRPLASDQQFDVRITNTSSVVEQQLAHLCADCLRLDPGRRPRDAREVSKLLARVMSRPGTQGAPATVPLPTSRPNRTLHSLTAPVALATASVLLIAAALWQRLALERIL